MKVARAATLLLLVGLAGCIDRSRINSACRWADPVVGPLDLHDASQRGHLRDDVLVAEELGIRLGDTFRGIKSIEERRRLREDCTASLFGEITRAHHVTVGEIHAAQEERDITGDIAVVLLPMLVVFVFAARHYADRVRRSFEPDDRWMTLLATVLLSFAISGAILLIGTLWAWLVEMLRLGSSHLSYRAARMPWRRYAPALFIGAVLLFWLIAWRRRRQFEEIRRT
jgi:hypothetical protein